MSSYVLLSENLHFFCSFFKSKVFRDITIRLCRFLTYEPTNGLDEAGGALYLQLGGE